MNDDSNFQYKKIAVRCKVPHRSGAPFFQSQMIGAFSRKRYARVGVVVKNVRYFALLTNRTNRSSKNCAGLAAFASGMDSDRKSKMP